MIDTTPDTRWICYLCANLDRLDADGLCRDCQPREPRSTATMSELAAEIVFGPPVRRERGWRIE